MKRIRLSGVSLIMACTLSAVAAASAAASPEFDAQQYPVKVAGASANTQGFADSLGAFAWACEQATFSTEEEGLANPTTNRPTLTAHPIYGLPKPTKCVFTQLGATS